MDEKGTGSENRGTSMGDIEVGEEKGKELGMEGIGKGEWDEYFKKLLGEIEGKVVRGRRERLGGRVRREEEEMLGREEIRRAIDRGKDNKAVGIDGVPSEVWKYEGEELEKWV